MPILKRVTGDAAGQIIELKNEITLIGRSPECQIVLDPNGVSRRHAEIRRVGEEFFLADLRSRNKTKVNNAEDMQNADKDHAIILAVTRDGKMYLGSKQIALSEITTSVKDQISNRLDKTVFVRSDARAKYGDVVSVVDNIRNAGVDQIGLLTERMDDQVRK